MDVITFPEKRWTTSGLQILLHGVISLPNATSYDKFELQNNIIMIEKHDLEDIYYILMIICDVSITMKYIVFITC